MLECRDGLPNLCSAPDIGGTAGICSDGGMASYVSLPAGKLIRLPDEVSMHEGAWMEPVALRAPASRWDGAPLS